MSTYKKSFRQVCAMPWDWRSWHAKKSIFPEVQYRRSGYWFFTEHDCVVLHYQKRGKGMQHCERAYESGVLEFIVITILAKRLCRKLKKAKHRSKRAEKVAK